MGTKSKVKVDEDSARGDFVFAPILACSLDGVIRYNHEDKNTFIDGPGSVEIYDDVEDVLWNYRNEGYILTGLSNEDSVAYGFKDKFSAHREVDAMIDRFDRNPFFSVQLCFDHPGGDHSPHDWRSLRRKPNIGMLGVLEKELYENEIIPNWDESIIVGKTDEDVQLAKNASITFINSSSFFNRE